MEDWLLIITTTSELYAGETSVTNVTMHTFATRGLCESAGRQAAKLVNKTKGYPTVEYKCFRQGYGGEWVEGEMK